MPSDTRNLKKYNFMTYSFSIQQEAHSSHQKAASECKEETSKVLYMEHSFVWCWNLDTSENRSEIPFWNDVPKENEVDQFEWLCEKWRSVTQSQGKAVPLQACTGPEGSRKLSFPDFVKTAQDGGKVVSLTHRPHLPPGNTPGTHFC